MKLHEVLNRNDQLKEILLKAIDQAAEKYADDFDGDKATKAKEKLKFTMTKMEMEATLKSLGIGKEGTSMSREIAQTILTNAQRLDK